jgi:chorismate mutase
MSDLSPEFQSKLQNFRNQIDTLDEEITALLHKRIGIVGQVGELKREAGLKSYIRSGREAQMVRNTYQAFKDTDFHPHAAAMIWRHIIAASIHHEAPQTLAIPANPKNSPLPWAAADYFGHFVPQKHTSSTQEALEFALQDTAAIAILPAESIEQWAQELAKPEFSALKIFVKFPFIPTAFESGISAFGAAQIMPEATGADTSLFFDGTKMIAREGYCSELSLEEKAKFPHSVWLGSYAIPLGES